MFSANRIARYRSLQPSLASGGSEMSILHVYLRVVLGAPASVNSMKLYIKVYICMILHDFA